MNTKKYNYICNNKKGGYIALLSTLVGAALASTLIVTQILQGVSSTQATQIIEQTALASGFADACVEYALEQIRQTTAYSGSGSLSFEHGSCEFSVISLQGQNRRIESQGISGDAIRRVEVIGINPQIEIESWRRVVDF